MSLTTEQYIRSAKRKKTYMSLVYHGGRCCGVKHIYHLGHDKKGIEPKLKKLPTTRGMDLCETSNAGRFFWPKAPRETALNRLIRYVEFTKEQRPQGCIEIILDEEQEYEWEDVLIKDLGFKMVTEFVNSSTYETLRVYHRTYNHESNRIIIPNYYKPEGDLK